LSSESDESATIRGTACVATLIMQRRLASEHGLVLAPPASLTKRATGLTYMRGALASPPVVALAVFTGCLGLGFAGLLGAMLAILATAILGIMSTRYAFVRRHLDRQAEQREKLRIESARFRALRPAGVIRQSQYGELRGLVETVETNDPADAARFELQDLLDHFVATVLAHHRCLEALRLAGNELPIAAPMIDAPRSKRRREIQARRIRHRDECLQRIEKLADEIDATDELIRLVAQRAACPVVSADLDREIERRLWEIDEVDAAIHQLSA
jgi:hypothetical protein